MHDFDGVILEDDSSDTIAKGAVERATMSEASRVTVGTPGGARGEPVRVELGRRSIPARRTSLTEAVETARGASIGSPATLSHTP
jgi:hypothetical protein